ncbi:MAG: hypothetical protein QXL54_01785 [Candidatus Bathyarchaeia archaeon]
MGNLTLYVKSEKIPIVQYSEGISGHPCTGAYRVREIIKNFKPEDKEAVEVLNEAGINYKLIDLSDGSFTIRVAAKIQGINETPTLVLENGEKIKGIQNIKQVIPKIRG